METMGKLTIYGHENAGRNAWVLMETVATSGNHHGWVELHRTLSERKRNDGSILWPVYKVILAPPHWRSLDKAEVDELFEIAKRFGCQLRFSSRVDSAGYPHFVAEFMS